MPLWLALFLPALPLQLAERALEQSRPLAIVAGPAQRPVVAYCNDCARAAGIRPGQKLAAAQAFARDLIALPQQPAVEHDALHELACWAYQFSSLVVAPGTTSSHKYSHSHSHASHQSGDSHDTAHVTQGLLIETAANWRHSATRPPSAARSRRARPGCWRRRARTDWMRRAPSMPASCGGRWRRCRSHSPVGTARPWPPWTPWASPHSAICWRCRAPPSISASVRNCWPIWIARSGCSPIRNQRSSRRHVLRAASNCRLTSPKQRN